MSSPSVNNRGPPSSSEHIIGHGSTSKYQPCYPCNNNASSASSASKSMEEDDEPNTITPPQLQEHAANVGDLMAKAKKAAASLWLILHAQNCRQPQGTCAHRGCDDTKLLLVHVKTCPAGPNFPCPSCTKGCNETRKLLAHYRRCKDLRLKQVGLGRRTNGMQPDQNSCLVCSLMARYAKNAADRHRSQGRSNNTASLLADALSSNSCSMSGAAKFNLEKSFATNLPTTQKASSNGVRKPSFGRTNSAQLMPPPPPRHSSALSGNNPGTSNDESWVESPPRNSMLMHSKIVQIAAITDPESKESLSDASILGKSVDSSVQVPFPILRNSSKEELVVPAAPQRRLRAESYDERRVKFAATVTSRHYYTAPQEEHFMVPDPLSAKNTGRPRSVSCGNMERNHLVTTPSNNNFDTIAEGEEHEEVFEMN